MHEALSTWLERLKRVNLPAMPRTSETLTRLCKDENVSLYRLAEVVCRDPGLTVALMRKMATLKHRHLSAEIDTVEHALMMLGLARVRTVPTMAPSADGMKDPKVREQLMQLYARSLLAAHFAREWARARNDFVPDEIYLAAQLHNLGEMVLWIDAPEKMFELRDLLANSDQTAEEAAYVVFGFSLEQVTRELAVAWGLPAFVRESLLPENAQQARVLGVMLAAQLARAVEGGWYTAPVTRLLEQVAAYLRSELPDTIKQVHEQAVQAAREATNFGVTPAAALLLYPAEPQAEPGWHSPEGAFTEMEHEAGAICLVPQSDVYRSAIHTLSSSQGLRLPQVLETAITGMHEGAGLSRVVFCLLGKDRMRLKAHLIVGSDDPGFNRFAIDLYDNNLFTQLMKRPQAIWINDTNIEKFWPMVPEPLKELVGTQTFFALSVFVDQKPVGLFYADRHAPDCRLDGNAYHQFKQLALHAAKALSEGVKNG